jgi:hypothetical protein
MKQIDIQFSGYGHFKVTTTYRGKQYSTVTTNTLAIDRYRNTDISDRAHAQMGQTRNQAATALYNEIKRANNL